ncbi:MAG: DR2241 family protein [Halobacteriales archaeon]
MARRPPYIEALLDAVSTQNGVDHEELLVKADTDGYTLKTASTDRTGLSERELVEAATDTKAVTNWYFWTETVGTTNEARTAFLRWLERGWELSVSERYDQLRETGIDRSWGQLHIHTTLEDGFTRRYTIRHEADAGADPETLDRYSDPLDARELVKYDERDRYRPLKTAPTLPTGWVFPALPAVECYRTVDTIYPATIANWHRERRDELDIDHWVPTAERQTGIYDIIDELDRETVEWIAESCCVDSQCLKRREWDYDTDEPLDVDRGDGEFPCREPCSLVIAAARKWTTLEREETRTYEIELTPSEREQLSEIVAAVADGRIDEIREADVYEDANRYRARFLRAKRFQDGELPFHADPDESSGE